MKCQLNKYVIILSCDCQIPYALNEKVARS